MEQWQKQWLTFLCDLVSVQHGRRKKVPIPQVRVDPLRRLVAHAQALAEEYRHRLHYHVRHVVLGVPVRREEHGKDVTSLVWCLSCVCMDVYVCSVVWCGVVWCGRVMVSRTSHGLIYFLLCVCVCGLQKHYIRKEPEHQFVPVRHRSSHGHDDHH